MCSYIGTIHVTTVIKGIVYDVINNSLNKYFVIIPRRGYCFEVSVSVDPWVRRPVGPSALNLRKQRLLKYEIYSAVGPLSKCVQRLVIFQIG